MSLGITPLKSYMGGCSGGSRLAEEVTNCAFITPPSNAQHCIYCSVVLPESNHPLSNADRQNQMPDALDLGKACFRLHTCICSYNAPMPRSKMAIHCASSYMDKLTFELPSPLTTTTLRFVYARATAEMPLPLNS